jgi:hypothetical protein
MDPLKRTALIAEIAKQPAESKDSLPVVSVERFFDGNDDLGSIGCNLLEHPGISVFRETLLRVRAREDVQDVLVEIYEVEESDPDMWPFSERVYVLTSASDEAVSAWVAELQPDEVAEGWSGECPRAAPALLSGIRVVSVWWD